MLLCQPPKPCGSSSGLTPISTLSGGLHTAGIDLRLTIRHTAGISSAIVSSPPRGPWFPELDETSRSDYIRVPAGLFFFWLIFLGKNLPSTAAVAACRLMTLVWRFGLMLIPVAREHEIAVDLQAETESGGRSYQPACVQSITDAGTR